MDDLIVGDLVIPGSDLEERFDTPGGPGGQHANRTASAVTLRFDVTASSLPEAAKTRLLTRLGEVVEVRASDSRSQARNREIARDRLAQRLEDSLKAPKKRKRTKPSKAARERRLTDKKSRSEVKRARQKPRPDD